MQNKTLNKQSARATEPIVEDSPFHRYPLSPKTPRGWIGYFTLFMLPEESNVFMASNSLRNQLVIGRTRSMPFMEPRKPGSPD